MKADLYIFYLSDNPVYLICSYKDSVKLGKEVLGLLTWPDRNCPEGQAYAISDEYIYPQ